MWLMLSVLIVVALLATTSSSQPALPAFPKAQGFGATATGGRGGRVVFVTNLRSSGAGSLQAALDQRGPRTILFRVSGVVEGVPIASSGDFTLAGQSSPSGITLRGLMIQGDSVCEEDSCPLPKIAPSNFIVRYLRLRAPLPDGSDGDGLRLHRAKRGIIDHVSVGNATDEAIQISLSSDITIQHSLIAETLGEHNDLGGMLINYADPKRGYPLTRLSIHHNVWSRIGGRMPEVSSENPSSSNSTIQIEISNNVLHDHTYPIFLAQTSVVNAPNRGYDTAPIYYRANIVGNLSLQNPQLRTSVGLVTLEGAGSPEDGYLPRGTPTKVFMLDNRTTSALSLRDWQLVYCCNDYREAAQNLELPFLKTGPSWASATRLEDLSSIAYTPSADLLSSFSVGASPLDAFDTRILKFVRTATFDATPRNRNPYGDALTQPQRTPLVAPQDSDDDGMPDSWEQTNGLDPRVADANATLLSQRLLAGQPYTNLEVYLMQLAR